MKTVIYNTSRGLIFIAFAKALLLTTSCNTTTVSIDQVHGKQITITDSISQSTEITKFINPYKKSIDEQMGKTLCYNPTTMNKNDYPYNTPIGNMLATIIRQQATPIYHNRTGKSIDLVLLNHGGIRAGLPAGPVTMRNAYEIMPFENEITIVELTGSQVLDMVSYLVAKKRAHPIDGMQIILKTDGSLHKATINKNEIKPTHIYTVATNDYLYNGGDQMTFFNNSPMIKIDYKIRNAIIDYFKKIDTLHFSRDDRFIIMK